MTEQTEKTLISNPQKAIRKILFAFLAVALALLIGFIAQVQLIGHSLDNESQEPPEYVGEVRLYQGKTLSEAVERCKKDGFIPVNENLNEGTDFDAVVIGYIPTKNEEEATTDIRMMQMTSGFSTVNYAELVERQYPGVDDMINDEYKTIVEFREKVSSGSYNAKIALDYLNLFKIPEYNMNLGDYYISDKLDRAMLKKLFLQTAATVSTTSYGMLALGVSDCSESNWASRVYSNKDILDVGGDEEDSVDAGTNPFAELDKKYLSGAESLVTVLHDFATHYQNGAALVAENGGDYSVLNPDEMSEKEMNERGGDALYIAAHDTLNQYKFDDNTLLGDWLVEMGCLTLSNKAELRQLYPLIASMSFGQIITTQMVGIQTCVCYLNDLSEGEKDFSKKIKEAKEICQNYDKTESISVWSGVDQKMFEQDCAVTGDAQRYTNLRDTADNLVKQNRAIQVLEAISSACSVIMKVAGGIAAVAATPLMLAGWFESIALFCCQHWTIGFIFCALGKIAAYIGAANTLLLVVILIIMLIVFLYECFKPENDDLDYTSIPLVTMDLSVDNNNSEKRGLLRYDLIKNPDGRADLNAYDGKQWNALYTSQNDEAGKPIQIVSGKEPFKVQKNNSGSPAGYKPVRNFNELYAANLNANVREEDAPQIYLFYSSGEAGGTSQVKETEAPQEENTPEAFDPNEKHTYIASLYLSCEKSETEAKLKLTQKGYNVIDVNLSPDVKTYSKYGSKSVNTYTYLGYTITTNPKAAVTDIRMVKIRSTSQAVMYGTVKYTAAGYDALNNSICYSKDPNAGSPILADEIQVARSFGEAKKGYEPVCYLGGTVYNFDFGEDDEEWENARYIYFSPSEKYTSGQEYISGIFFVSGADANESGWSLEDYAEKLGGKLLGKEDFTKGRRWIKTVAYGSSGTDYYVENLQTFLCYTTTYNPKRALYDVQFYAGTPRMQNFVTNLSAYTGNSESNYAQTGYGITSVFMQSCKKMGKQSGKTIKDQLYHYEVNNYDDFTVSSGEQFDCEKKEVDNIIPGVKWKTIISQPRMLYGCGYKEGYSPLRPGDLVLSGSAEAPAGFASIQDVRFPYEKKSLNLAYYYSGKSDVCTPAYLYINRAAPVRGKYIASVRAAIYNPDPKWNEDEREANNAFSNDSCYIALAGSTTELINTSLALLPGDSWLDTPGYDGNSGIKDLGPIEYNSKAAYIGVTYTDNPSKAIHGIIRLRAHDGVKPAETMTVNGAKYTLVENVLSKEPIPFTSPNLRQYYLYTTTSSGGSSTGDPITEINISPNIFEPDMSTVLTVDHGDIDAQKDFYGNVTQAGEYVLPAGDTNDTLYIHTKTNASLTGIDSFFVGVGDSDTEAMKDLLTQGATCYLPLNLNEGAGTNACVYIGYHYYNPDYVNTKRTKYYMESAVKDLYVYEGENPPKRITVDGRKYTLCGDRNLNYGTDGKPMYLYQTTAMINDKDKANASYITKVGAAQYDRVPADIAEYKWENLLTTDNKRINLNEGVRGFDLKDDEQHLRDSRVYVFVHRNDNYVKPEAVITGGYTTDTTTFGDVVLNKK